VRGRNGRAGWSCQDLVWQVLTVTADSRFPSPCRRRAGSGKWRAVPDQAAWSCPSPTPVHCRTCDSELIPAANRCHQDSHGLDSEGDPAPSTVVHRPFKLGPSKGQPASHGDSDTAIHCQSR
jgi:hypothetical protein